MILTFQDTDANGKPLDFATSTQPNAGLVFLTPHNPPAIEGNDFVSGDRISASFASGTASFSHAVAAVYCGEIVSDWGSTPFKLDLSSAIGTVNAKDYRVTTFQSISSASYSRFAATASYVANVSSVSTASYALNGLISASNLYIPYPGIITLDNQTNDSPWTIDPTSGDLHFVNNNGANAYLTSDGQLNVAGLVADDFDVKTNSVLQGGTLAAFSTVGTYVNLRSAGTGSYSITASWATNAINGGTTLTTASIYPITASWALNSKTASFVANAVTASTFNNGTAKLLGDNSITGASDIAASGTVSGNNVSVNTLAIPGGTIVAADASGKLTSIPSGSTLAVTASYALSTPSTGSFSIQTILTGSGGGITCSFSGSQFFQVNITNAGVYTFTSSNVPTANGSRFNLLFNNTAAGTSSLSFPAGWRSLSGGWPTQITASKIAELDLKAWAGTVVGGWIAEL